MRSLLAFAVLFGFVAPPARPRIPAGTWLSILTPRGDYPPGTQARLSRTQAEAVTRFVRMQYRLHSDFFDTTSIGDCSTVDCLDIRSVPLGHATAFLVSPTPHDKNPAWWLVELAGPRITDVTPKYEKAAIGFGYVEVQPDIHHGMHDLSVRRTFGAPHQRIAYLEFDGLRYRVIESEAFSWCGTLPGKNPDDESWCFDDGRRVGGG